MRRLRSVAYWSAGILMTVALIANAVVGIYALVHYYGLLGLLGLLFLPITVVIYPFVVWGLEGETVYLAIWGGLWAVFLLGAAIVIVAEKSGGAKD